MIKYKAKRKGKRKINIEGGKERMGKTLYGTVPNQPPALIFTRVSDN